MRGTGMVRRVDHLGRIVLPKEIRTTMGLVDGTTMEIFVEGDDIILKQHESGRDMKKSLNALELQVEENVVELGPEKAGEVRRHIRDIRMLLKEMD